MNHEMEDLSLCHFSFQITLKTVAENWMSVFQELTTPAVLQSCRLPQFWVPWATPTACPDSQPLLVPLPPQLCMPCEAAALRFPKATLLMSHIAVTAGTGVPRVSGHFSLSSFVW